MRIAIDAREIVGAVAGKGRYVAEVVKALATIDKENIYFLYSKQPIDIELPKNFQNVLIGGLPGLRQLWLALDAKKRGCDLFFSPTGYLPVIFSLIPSVVVIHDLAIFVTKDARPAIKTLIAERLLLGLAVRKAKYIVAVSESTKNDLVRLFAVSENKIVTTLLGYDKTAYHPQTRNDTAILKNYNLKPNYLLFVGTVEPRKNIVGVVKAYSRLSKELQIEYPLVIAGKKGWFYDEIFAAVKELGLEKEIYFLGRVPDEHLPALYRNATIFLFPSFYEGFGLPVLEALACGTPVVTANISSLPEVVGETGVLVDPYNTDEISQAIEKLLTDDKTYTTLKEKSPKQASKFDWEKTAKLTLKIFEHFRLSSRAHPASSHSSLSD